MADYIRIKNGTTDALPVSAESGNGYCKMADGTLIQWGSVACTNPSSSASTMSQVVSSGIFTGTVRLSFSENFINTSYMVTGCSKYDTGYEFPYGVITKAAANVILRLYDFHARPLNDGKMVIQYLAIGRWK